MTTTAGGFDMVPGMDSFGRFVASSSVLAIASAACFALALVLTQPGLRHRSPLAGAIISVPTTALLFWLLAPWTRVVGDRTRRRSLPPLACCSRRP